MPGTAASGRSWSGYAVGNFVRSGCPAAIGVDQLSISFQSGLSLDAAVSTSNPVYPVWPWAPGAMYCCLVVLVEFEELTEHGVRRVEEVVGQVVARVHEAGFEASANAVDDGTTARTGARLERQQVDIEDLVGHRAQRYPSLRFPDPPKPTTFALQSGRDGSAGSARNVMERGCGCRFSGRAAGGEQRRPATGVDEDHLGAEAVLGGEAEQPRAALAGVRPVQQPATPLRGPPDRCVAGLGRHGIVVTDPARVDLDVLLATMAVDCISVRVWLASPAMSGRPTLTPFATPMAMTSGTSRPACAAAARPARSPAWVPPLDEVNTT